jgi:hypothetical protein
MERRKKRCLKLKVRFGEGNQMERWKKILKVR